MENKEIKYNGLFEKSVDEITEDIFFRADNFKDEKWYDDFQMYMRIGVCQPDKENVSELQKALKIMGYSTREKERDGQLFLVPNRDVEKQSQNRKRQDLER